VKFASADSDPGILSQIATMADAGQVKPVVSAVFPLQNLGDAHALSETYHARGKIAVKVVE
jgi:NADPH:quinone reductase-like Zn-dependent oxidoreductase